MGDVVYSLFGPVRAWRAGKPLDLGPRQQKLVLAVLLLNVNRVVLTSSLAEAIWGEEAPSRAGASIRVHVHRLRTILGGPAIESVPGGYVLRADDDAVDVTRLRSILRAATNGGSGEVAESSASLLKQMISGGFETPLSDVRGDFAHRQRDVLRTMWVDAAEQLAALEIQLGRASAAIAPARWALEVEPLRERLHELLVLAQYASGSHAEAHDSYRAAERVLRDELGLGPGPRLREVHERFRDAPPALRNQVPAAGNPQPFVGREDHLRALDAAAANGGARPVAIVGMAGVGKTTLVRHWASRQQDRFPDGQVYLDLHGFDPGRGALEPGTALVSLLDSLGVVTDQLPTSLAALSSLYRGMLADRRCLIVLDNARDTEQVKALLPGESPSLAVVTSRTSLAGLLATTGAEPLALDLLSEREAQELLTLLAGWDRVAADQNATGRIISACGGLPLALAVAGARENMSFADIAEELTRGNIETFYDNDPRADVRSVLSWSHHALPADAGRLLCMLALHPATEFGLHAVASLAGCSVRATRVVLRHLTDASLVTAGEPGRYGMHDLVRAYAIEAAKLELPEAEMRNCCRRLHDYFLHSALRGYQQQLEEFVGPEVAPAAEGTAVEPLGTGQQAMHWFRAESETILTLVEKAAESGFPGHAAPLAWYSRMFHVNFGRWRDMARMNQDSLKAAAGLGNLEQMAYAHQNLAFAEDWLGRPEKSLRHHRDAVAIFRELDVGLPLGHLLREEAHTRARAGDFLGAGECVDESFSILSEAGGPLDLASLYHILAWTKIVEGRPEEALRRGLQANEIYARSGRQRSGCGAALLATAIACEMLGHMREAMLFYGRASALGKLVGSRAMADGATSAYTRLCMELDGKPPVIDADHDDRLDWTAEDLGRFRETLRWDLATGQTP